MTARPRHRLVAAGLSLLLLVALLGVLEGGLRLAGLGPRPLPSPFTSEGALDGADSGALSDVELFYRLRPDSRFLDYYAINSLGYRGADVAPERPQRTLRVVCTGDSSTFGLGVPEERAWPSVLQRLLDAALGDLRPVEVVNAGVPGYTSFQNRMQVERDLLPLRPDLLVWMPTGHNDNARVAGRNDREALEHRRSLAFRLSRTAIGRAVGIGADTGTPADPGTAADALAAGDDRRPRVDLADFESNLRAVADACRAAGVPLLLVVPPHDAVVRQQRPEEKAAEDVVLRVARDLSLPCCDPRPDLDALAPRPLYPDTVHPNADGQAVLGWRTFESVALNARDIPWMEPRAAFAKAWVMCHRGGLVSNDCVSALLDRGAPPRFLEAADAARAGAGAASSDLAALDPVQGERRGPYGLGREMLLAAAAGPFAGNSARLDELRVNVAPCDDLALLLFGRDLANMPKATPPADAVAAARALAALDASLGAHPEPKDRRLFEAQRLADAGDTPGALALIDAVLTLNPRCAEALGVRGQALERAGQREQALMAYEQGAALEPDSSVGLFLLGRAQLQRGDNAGAEASLRKVLEADPAHKLARLGLVRALMRQGHLQDAEAQLRTLRRVGATGLADIEALQAEIDKLRAAAPGRV